MLRSVLKMWILALQYFYFLLFFNIGDWKIYQKFTFTLLFPAGTLKHKCSSYCCPRVVKCWLPEEWCPQSTKSPFHLESTACPLQSQFDPDKIDPCLKLTDYWFRHNKKIFPDLFWFGPGLVSTIYHGWWLKF